MSSRLTVTHTSWEGFIADQGFGDPADRRFHLGLLPKPFAGDLMAASIVVLLLNPGMGPSDYYGEYQVASYRKALLQNLSGNHSGGRNIFLDPAFAWHGGFSYWHAKFQQIVGELADFLDIARTESLAILAAQVAILEFIPYHSTVSKVPLRITKQLRSPMLAKQFVHDVLAPKAKKGEVLIIVTRYAKHWDLPESENVIIYSSSEARAAHLTPNSRGGAAILAMLKQAA